MTRNQKLLIGLAGAGVLAYLLFKGSKAKAQTTPTGTTDVKSKKCEARLGEFGVECNDGSCDVSNGVAMPCRGKAGGVKGSTLEQIQANSTFPSKKPVFDPTARYTDDIF